MGEIRQQRTPAPGNQIDHQHPETEDATVEAGAERQVEPDLAVLREELVRALLDQQQRRLDPARSGEAGGGRGGRQGLQLFLAAASQ